MAYRKIIAAVVATAATFCAGAASAALVFVGSWQLTDGPSGASLGLSGQEAAAQLFGGVAADYTISTAGAGVGDVDGQSWYLIFDIPGAALIDSQSATDFFGLGISAYAFDPELSLTADRYTNYAFKESVGATAPEPATWALMIGGLGLAGVAIRRRRRLAA